MIVVLIILIYSTIAFFEIVPLVKEKQKKELILYSSILASSFILNVLFGLGIKLPSLARFIESIVEAMLSIFSIK